MTLCYSTKYLNISSDFYSFSLDGYTYVHVTEKCCAHRIHLVLVHTCRHQKDSPVVMDSHIEEAQQRERTEKIQTYRLVREHVLECRKQEAFNRKELMKRQLEMYQNMQVSDREGEEYNETERNEPLWLSKWKGVSCLSLKFFNYFLAAISLVSRQPLSSAVRTFTIRAKHLIAVIKQASKRNKKRRRLWRTPSRQLWKKQPPPLLLHSHPTSKTRMLARRNDSL